jgi:two-component SAPR family response regulator
VFPENILLVEDNLMLAIDMSDMLKQIGVQTVEKCATVSQAKHRLTYFTPNMAILDISLRDEESFEIAYLLKQEEIPFCFATGYGSEFPVPEDLQDRLVLSKPVDIDILRSTLQKLNK